jgi:hypothetical protein
MCNFFEWWFLNPNFRALLQIISNYLILIPYNAILRYTFNFVQKPVVGEKSPMMSLSLTVRPV